MDQKQVAVYAAQLTWANSRYVNGNLSRSLAANTDIAIYVDTLELEHYSYALHHSPCSLFRAHICSNGTSKRCGRITDFGEWQSGRTRQAPNVLNIYIRISLACLLVNLNAKLAWHPGTRRRLTPTVLSIDVNVRPLPHALSAPPPSTTNLYRSRDWE